MAGPHVNRYFSLSSYALVSSASKVIPILVLSHLLDVDRLEELEGALVRGIIQGGWHIPHGTSPAPRAWAELEKVTSFEALIFLAALQLG